jgi:general secretion pathway protein F
MRKASFSPLGTDVKILLFNHLATMEKAGLPVIQSFAHLHLSGAARDRVKMTLRHLKRGKDIATAGASAGLFDYLEASIIHAASNAGSPALIYRRLAQRYEEKSRLEKMVRSKLKLPFATLGISLILRQLPAFATGHLSLFSYLSGICIPALSLVFLWKIWMLIKRDYEHTSADNRTSTSLVLDNLILKLPVFGPMHIRSNARNFYEALAILMEAGMPLFEAIPLASKTIKNSRVRIEYDRILPMMLAGECLSIALEKNTFRGERHIIDMLRTGEAAGSIPEMLNRYCQAESQALSMFQQQLADWIPRIIYALVCGWVIYGIFTSHAFTPSMPTEVS